MSLFAAQISQLAAAIKPRKEINHGTATMIGVGESNRKLVLEAIERLGPVGAQKVADEIGMTREGVSNHIRKLFEAGIVSHASTYNRGSWVVVGKDRTNHQKCTSCGEWKDLELFEYRKDRKTYCRKCKKCRKDRSDELKNKKTLALSDWCATILSSDQQTKGKQSEN